MLIQTAREPEGGDILYRQKENGAGWHYGRLVETAAVFPSEVIANFNLPPVLVPHTTPEKGKHLDTTDDFFGGLPGGWIPVEASDLAKLGVQQASVANLGAPYTPIATCEDDVFGFSPTRNRIFEGLVGLGLVVIVGALAGRLMK